MLTLFLNYNLINQIFILLCIYLTLLSIYNLNFLKYNELKFKEYNILILLMIVICLIFMTNNLFNFYILFELTLPLLFLLIALYGSKYRIKASYYIFIYTLFGSLFLLIGLILYSNFSNNIFIDIFSNIEISNINIEILIYIFIFLGFLVKIPQFPFHIWLSFAHTEAPVSGSIILAGIVLKLPVYGILIILINLLPNAHEICMPYISWLAIFTLFYITSVTLIQNDTKVIVAYSSIAHMSIVVLGLFSNNIYGIIGSIILSLGHGLASPGLFALVGDYIYKIYHSRLLNIVRGLLQYNPLLTIFLFLFSLANISFPGTLNFLGELNCLIGVNNYLLLLFGCFTILFSSIITFNLLTKVIFRDSILINPSVIISRTQFLVLMLLFIPLLFFGIFSETLFYNLGYFSLDYLI